MRKISTEYTNELNQKEKDRCETYEKIGAAL